MIIITTYIVLKSILGLVEPQSFDFAMKPGRLAWKLTVTGIFINSHTYGVFLAAVYMGYKGYWLRKQQLGVLDVL